MESYELLYYWFFFVHHISLPLIGATILLMVYIIDKRRKAYIKQWYVKVNWRGK
jgi:hypothetical protein